MLKVHQEKGQKVEKGYYYPDHNYTITLEKV